MVLLTMVLTKYALISNLAFQTKLSNFDFIIFSISVLFITAGGYIINDIYDVGVDKINKPKKVWISTSFTYKRAWSLYAFLTVTGVAIGCYLSYDQSSKYYSFYFIGVSLSLFIYSRFLKKVALIGNILIAILCSLVVYLVYLFDFQIDPYFKYKSTLYFDDFKYIFTDIGINFYIALCFLTTLIRELLKDIEDIKGDYNLGYKTLPIIFGVKRTRRLLIFMSILLFLYISMFVRELSVFYFYVISFFIVLILIVLLYFIYKLWNTETKRQYHFLSNLMKVIMILGIVSMGLFNLI
ncbi:MAG: geranylgeranylglycerol-phosphate geranylgeranyltransferase [Flavobacteriaceae bacterium]